MPKHRRIVPPGARTTLLCHERLESRAVLATLLDGSGDLSWPQADVAPSTTAVAVEPTLNLAGGMALAASSAALPTTGLLLRYETVGTSPYALTSGAVTTWNDQAGTADNAATVNGPKLITAGTPAGRPSLAFSGTNSLKLGATAALNGAQTLTWFVVFKQGNTTPGALLRTETSANSKYWGTYNNAGSLVSQSRNSSGTIAGPSGAFVERNNWHISSTVWNGTGSAVNGTAAATVAAWIDGSSLGTGSAAGANGVPGTHVSTTIGANGDGSLGFTGEIAAVLVYNACLSAADRQAVEAYLQETYFKVSTNAAIQDFLGAGTIATQTIWSGSGGRDIVTAKDGSLVMVRDTASAKVVRRSTDGGVTWSADAVMHPIAFGAEGKLIVNETNGQILFVCPMDTQRYRSTDNGLTWKFDGVTDGFNVLPNSLGHVPTGINANQPGITIMRGPNAGRLLIPARWVLSDAIADRPKAYSCAIYSDDQGWTWQTSEPFPDRGTGEAALAELSNGNILYSSREHMTKDFRHFAWSYDSGATYTGSFVSPVLPDGPRGSSYGLMGGLVRMPVPGADILLYSNIDTDAGQMPSEPGGSNTVGREKMTVWASFDGGQTWPVKRLVYAGPSGYSNLAVGRAGTPSAGKIFLDYEGGPSGSASSVRVATFDLNWLLNGWNVDTFFNPTSADVTTTATWEGLTGSNTWGAGNNWVGATPVFDNTLDVTFSAAGAGNLTNALSADRNVRALTFNADTDAAVAIYLADTTANGAGRTLRLGSGSGKTVTHTVAAGATGDIQIGFADVGAVELANPTVINHAGSGAFGFGSPITGAAGYGLAINSTGTGNVFLSSANTFAGGVTLNSGLLRVGDNNGLGTGTFTITGGTLANASSTVRTVSNTVNVRGNLTLGATRAAPTLAGTVDLGNATRTLTVDVSSTISGPIVNGGLTKAGAATLLLTGANTYTGVTTVNAGTLAVGDGTSGGIASGSGVTIAAGATLSHNRGTTVTLANAIAGAGTLANDGTGELYLSGTNSFSGTIVADAKTGITSATADDGVPNVVANATFSIGEVFVGGTATINALSGGGFVDPVAGATSGTRTISVRSGDFAGVLRDGTNSRVLALTKAAAGTLRLAGSNTYTGVTTVSAGTLQVDGNQSAASGTVTVASGAALAGIGTVGGATTLQSGATLAPGATVGTLSFTRGLTLAGGGNYNWQVTNAGGTAGTGWDTVAVGGALAITATAANPFTINAWSLSGTTPATSGGAAGFDATQNQTWRIARATGGITGFAADRFQVVTTAANGTGGFSNTLSGGTFSVAQSGNDLNLVFTAGAVATPVIEATGTAAALSALLGTASSATTVAVTGANLAAAIVATAPAGFEVSSDGTTFAATAQFSPTAGAVSGTLSVRLAAATAVGTYSGNVVLASTGATSVNVALPSSTVTDTLVFDVAAGTTVTDAGGRSGAIKIVKRGLGTLTLTAAGGHAGTTTVEAGTVVVAAGDALAASAVTVQSGGTLKVNAGVTMRSPVVTVAGGTLDGTGATLLVNAASGIGTLAIASGSVMGSPRLTVSGNGVVTLPTDRRQVVAVTALSIDQAGGGRLDIGKGRIDIATGGTNEAELRADLVAGRNGGAFNGTSGIMTTGGKASAGMANPAVGYRMLSSGAAVVAWAAYGDANLDGQVSLTDITLVNNGLKYGAGVSSGAVWGQGDFNYSNGVTLTDVTLLNNAGLFGQGSYLPVTPTSASPATAPSGITSAGSGGPVISQDAWIALALSLETNSTRSR